MINNYDEDFRFLHKSMIENNLVVFVGAGVSMGSGYPSWINLVKDISEKLGVDIANYSDNTIIPQLYYNARGKKDYNETVHELFHKPNAKPNEMHENIVALNPKCVITTNYDTLLEQAFNESGAFLDVIEKDSDLPYAHSDNMIIKMHGGFKYNNFVLKEDDYLNYSYNFTLIETYIKALFARYTVLFIGYSFNDSDTKQIFSWVRNILHEDQQRAYLINVSDDYDSQTSDYYKNLGINIIYAKTIDENLTSLTDRTVFILDKIRKPKYNILAQLNQIFKEYEYLNYISGSYIQKAFKKFFDCGLENESLLIFFKSEEEFESIIYYFENPDKDRLQKTNNEYPNILAALEKSPIDKIQFRKNYEPMFKKDVLNNQHIDSMSEFEEFDYAKIKYNIIPTLNDDEENYIFKAYCYFQIYEYEQCYELLKKASRYFLSTNQIFQYLIAENNRINVGTLICNNYFYNLSETTKEAIRNEIEKINSIGIYANFSRSNIDNSIISDLLSFKTVYTNLYRIIDKSRKIDEESCKHYNFYAGIPAFIRVRSTAQDFYKHINQNHLLLDAYGEVKSVYYTFIDRIFFSIRQKESMKDRANGTCPVTLEKLSKFEIMIILNYLQKNEFKAVIAKYSIETIEIDEEAYKYVATVMENLSKSLVKGINKQVLIPKFNNLLLLCSYIPLPDAMCDITTNMIDMLLGDFIFEIDYNTFLNKFICKQYDFSKEIFPKDSISGFIIDICNSVSNAKDPIVTSSLFLVFQNLVAILNKIDSLYLIKFDDMSIQLYSQFLSLDFLIPLYSNVSDSFKELIKDKINLEIKEKNNVSVYYNALINNIIEPNTEYENNLYTAANSKAKNKVSPNAELGYCVNLYFSDQLLDRERFSELIKKDKVYSLLIEPENYDYDEQFELEILTTLTHGALQIIKDNETSYSEIHKVLKEYLTHNYDKDIARIYAKWFS